MGDGDIDSHDRWVEGVLGISLGSLRGVGASSGAKDGATSWAQAVSDWQDASERVDRQISDLQAVLKRAEFPFLQRIADAGLNGITGNNKVPVLTAIRAVSDAPADGRAASASKGIAAVDGFIAHLNSDPRVRACDRNPFGVAMSIQSTLVPALTALRAAMTAGQ